MTNFTKTYKECHNSGKFYFQALIYFESFPNYFDAVLLDQNSHVYAKGDHIFQVYYSITSTRLYTAVGMYSAVSVHCYIFTFKHCYCFVLIQFFFWRGGVRLYCYILQCQYCPALSCQYLNSIPASKEPLDFSRAILSSVHFFFISSVH